MKKISSWLSFCVFCLVLFSFFYAFTTSAACDSLDYYVATNGSDSNPGTVARPWRTIQKAANTVGPGATVYIKAGTYRERVEINVSGSSGGGFITFRNYGSQRVIIDASTIPPTDENPNIITIENKQYIKLIGLEIRKNLTTSDQLFIKGVQICGNSKHIELRNCKIHTIQNNSLSLDACANAIGVFGTNGTDAITDIVIDNCEIYNNHTGCSEAISCDGNVDGIEISNNYVHDNNNIGILISGCYGECPNPETDYVRNAWIHDNIITRISSAENPAYEGMEPCAGAIYSDGGRDSIIERNLVFECDHGIEVESEPEEDPDEGYFPTSSGIIIRDNIVANCGSCGIYIGSYAENLGWVFDIQVLNNTVYNCGTYPSVGRNSIEVMKCHDVIFKNNIIYTDNDNGVLLSAFSDEFTYNITMDNNVYYAPGGNQNTEWVWHGETIIGLDDWQDASGQDTNSVFANPLFTDASDDDFHLMTNSPAIDFGDPTFTPASGETDFEGNPRVVNNRVDCGAYEKQ